MDKWEIRPTQTSDDPDRHMLLLQGGPADVAALLKKFGALFGRPTPYQSADFNLSFVLHRLTPEIREKLETWLRRNGAPAEAAAPAPALQPAAASVPQPAVPLPVPAPAASPSPPPMPVLSPAPVLPSPAAIPSPIELAPPTVPAPVPAPEPVPAPAMPPLSEPQPAPAEMPALISLSPEPAVPAVPAPIPQPAPTIPLPVPQPAPTIPLPVPQPAPTVPLPMPQPAPTIPMPAPQTAPATAPITLTAPAAEPAPSPAAAPPPSGAQSRTPLSIPVRADWTMETLLVGAYNRFAHAAATQVIASPGSMYNPLFLWGVPCTGKSHLLQGIAQALTKGLGDTGILMTSGPRLALAVNAALAAKSMAEIERKVADSKALLVDDIHLMAVTDQNKDALGAIFKSFFERRQQVVITSLYPPRSLGALEEALKFSFSKGWSVDLKVPTPTAQKELIGAVADRTNSKLGNDDIILMNEKLSVWGYQDLTLWLRRIVTFAEMRVASGRPSSVTDLLMLCYEPTLSAMGEAPKPVANFQPPPVSAGAAPFAVIVPKDQQAMSTGIASLFHEVGAKHSFKPAYRHALWESYDSQVPFGVPFLIGEMCYRAGVTRALVVGPTPESPLGPRSAEFAQAVRRILESINVEMGWIPFSGVGNKVHYLNAHLDFASSPFPASPT